MPKYVQYQGETCPLAPSLGQAHQAGFVPLGISGDEGDLVPWGLGDCTPSCASCSRKLDHKSASDSFRPLLSGKKSVDRDGVLGVRCHGDNGTLRLGLDAPGLARPACSRCSSQVSKSNLSNCTPSLPSVQASNAAIICNI